ncbi:hypothetical protein QTP88_021828 [Uroleucon formosanum]
MSKRLSITSDQKEALVEFMENHFDLRKGKFSINFTTAIAKTQWEDCCKLLNSIPRPAKKWQECRKTSWIGTCRKGRQQYITTLDCDKEINVDDPGINKQSQALEIIPIYSSTLSITETKTSKDNIYLTEQFIPKNDFVFPKTNGRSCQLKWFNSFSWLHYVKEKNVVLCYPCALASQTKITKIKIHGQESFIDTGFQNWKKGTEWFSTHEKSENHRASIEYLNFRDNSRPVISLITEQSLNEQKEARTVFKIVISSIRYLARSGQAIRGGTWDSGNLIYLLQERSLENPALKIWLEKRNNWLSGDIQNELLETMAHFVSRKIKNSVLKSPFMAIMVDGTTDISGQEQFSICFRLLNKISLNINEIFVGMYNPPSGNAETLFSCITDLLTRICLSFENTELRSNAGPSDTIHTLYRYSDQFMSLPFIHRSCLLTTTTIVIAANRFWW